MPSKSLRRSNAGAFPHLLFGPYTPPYLGVGDRAMCQIRDLGQIDLVRQIPAAG